MSWDEWQPNLIWRLKTWLRNWRWAKYWAPREDAAHIAAIESYRKGVA